MIYFGELFRMAKHYSPGEPVVLPRILSVWAEKDPDQSLAKLLRDTGLTSEAAVEAMGPLASHPAGEERNHLKKFIANAPADATGKDLLQSLIDAPVRRIVRALVDAGLDVARLRKNLDASSDQPPPRPARLAGLDAARTERESVLLRYGRDLIEEAAKGDFNDLCERDKDVARLVEVLMKKKKGNAVLTGPAGVGKTSVAELLARMVFNGDVPPPLRDVKMFEINMGKLVAGTIYRGMFEERLQSVVAALTELSPSVGFIDEMHLLWGAGRAEGAPMDAANMLKPFLVRGEIRIVGATTSEEYHRYIAQDPALARRFEEIRLDEPSPELILKMAEKQTEGLRLHHGIEIGRDMAQAAVTLTDRYLPNQWQPDKSVDLLDAAAVMVLQEGRKSIREEDLLRVIARRTGKAVTSLKGGDRERLRGLAERIGKRIVGQDRAVDRVVSAVSYRRQRLGSEERNLGTFLFAGATGVGKTELARVLAEELFGKGNSLLHLDLAEYNDYGAVNKLLGAPAGYADNGRQGLLAEFLHRRGSGVLLFDEVEKAHPDIHRMLLGVLDNGRVRSGRGQRLDTRECVVIMTTNAIDESALNRSPAGFAKSKTDADPAFLLADHFPKEFLGRLDEIVLFRDLETRDYREIMALRLEEALARLAKRNIALKFDRNRLLDYLTKQMPRDGTGARGIARFLETNLLQPVAAAALNADELVDTMTVVLGENFYANGTVSAK